MITIARISEYGGTEKYIIIKIDDLENVFKINAQGVIIGKALYNGAINLSDAIDKFEKGEKNAY